MSFKIGDIISYNEMCMEEGFSLQRGMNFKVHGSKSIILMSRRKGAPYSDMVNENGTEIIYEGHDVPINLSQNPKTVDQEPNTPNGSLTENGKFYQSVRDYKLKLKNPQTIRVYEKIHAGIWVYNGKFNLVDSWMEDSNGRKVFKFKLVLNDCEEYIEYSTYVNDLPHNRVIPSHVKLSVWKRDKGKCVKCGSNVNLHFDHVLPYSKGGTSLKEENIQLLCAKHNLEKSNKLI